VYRKRRSWKRDKKKNGEPEKEEKKNLFQDPEIEGEKKVIHRDTRFKGKKKSPEDNLERGGGRRGKGEYRNLQPIIIQ